MNKNTSQDGQGVELNALGVKDFNKLKAQDALPKSKDEIAAGNAAAFQRAKRDARMNLLVLVGLVLGACMLLSFCSDLHAPCTDLVNCYNHQ
jgi:hypothetical protein